MIFLLLPFLSFSLQAQSDLVPNEIRPLVEFMSVATGDAKQVALAKSKEAIECNEQEKSKPIFFPGKIKDSEWKFTVTTSLTGPKGFERKFKEIDPYSANELEQITRTKYASHDERLKDIKKLCQNKSEEERILLGSHLGGLLSQIYDYDRKDGDKVLPQDQWQALYERNARYNYHITSGVCRDATFTIAQFMVACGFSKDKISIQSYETNGGGHQVVQIRDSKGQFYTINWSEVYAVEEKGGVTSDLNPSNINTGLDYYTYDADGKLVAFRRTELGNIIRAVAGGSINDLDYQPHLLKLEANYGRFSAAIFKAETQSHEKASGVGLSYIKNDEIFTTSVGMAYTKNDKEVFNGRRNVKVDQHILYFQIESGVKPKFTFNPTDNSLLIISPTLLQSSEFYVASSNIDQREKSTDFEKNFTSTLGLDAEFRKDNFTGWPNISTDLAFQARGNNEANEKFSPVIFNTTSIAAGAQYEGDKYVVDGKVRARFSYFEDSYSISTSVFNKQADASAGVMYKVYDRGSGFREDYVMISGEKNFTFERVSRVSLGAQAEFPVGDNPHDPTITPLSNLSIKKRPRETLGPLP